MWYRCASNDGLAPQFIDATWNVLLPLKTAVLEIKLNVSYNAQLRVNRLWQYELLYLTQVSRSLLVC